MAKKILLILAILLVIICAGIFYVNQVLLPVQIKGMIIKAAEEQLHRKVSLNALYYHPIKGVVLSGIAVDSKEKPGEPFLAVKEISAQVLLMPLLKKKVIVTSLRIDSPSARLVRFEPALWNFSDLLKPAKTETKSEAKTDFSLLISGIAVTNGRLEVTDLARGSEFNETAEAITLQGSLALNSSIKLSGSLSLPATQGSLKINASYSFPDKSFKAAVSVRNLVAARYLRFAPDLPLAVREFNIAEAEIGASGSGPAITVTGSGSFPVVDLDAAVGTPVKAAVGLQQCSLSLPGDGTMLFQGGITANGLAAQTSDGKTVAGNLKASVEKLTVNKADIAYSGSLEASGLHLTLDPAKTLSGTFRLNSIIFSLQNGRISATGNLDGRELALNLDNGLAVRGNLAWQGISINPSETGMTVQGELQLNQATITTAQGQTISGDIQIARPNVLIEGANLSGQADLALKGIQVVAPNLKVDSDNIAAPGTSFSVKNGVTDLSTSIDLNKLHVVLNSNLDITGDPRLTAHLIMDPKASQPLSYTGALDLNNFEISGLPTIERISRLNGKIDLQTDRAQVRGLSLSVLDTPIKVSGEITSFSAPALNLDASAETIDLALLEKVIPGILKEQELKITGSAADLSAHIEGKAADIANAKIRARVTLKDTSIESAKLKQKAEQISGLITYEPPSLLWKDLNIAYQGKTYVLNGHLQDFVNPVVIGSLKSSELTADFQVKKQGDRVGIEQLAGAYFDTTFSVTGSLSVAPGAEPTFAVNGEVRLPLSDLSKILPAEQFKPLAPLKPSGILKVKADIKGKPVDWMNWTSDITINSTELSIMGYKFENLRITAVQKDGTLNPLTAESDFYEGVIRATAKLDLRQAGFPVQSSFKLDSTNLAQLKRVTPLKDRRVEGSLTFATDIEGNITDLNSLKGNGSLNIKDGYLFDLPGLSLLSSILQTSTGVGDMASLKTVSATLQIDKGRVNTEDLHIKGPAVDILGQGWVGLDQNMDMTFKTTFLTTGSGNNALNVVSAIDPTGELTGVRIYGPLSKPKQEIQALRPTKVIPNMLKNTADSLLKLFQ